MSSAVRLWIGSPMARIACAKLSTEWCARHVAGVEMHLRGAVVVARDEAEQNFGEEAPLLRPEPAHDAEIDRDQPAVVVDEQIARMHVGVEEAVAQRMAQETSGSPRGRAAGRSRPLASSAARSRERRAVDPFEREHFARGAVPVHGRNAEIRILAGVLAPSRTARPLRAANPSRSPPSGASVATTSTRRRRRASAEMLSPLRAAKKKASRSALKRRSMPGRSTFTATGLRAPSDRRPRRGAPARSRRPPPAGRRMRIDRRQRLAEARLRPPPPPRPAGTAPSCPADFPDRARTPCRPRPAASPGTARA